MKLVVNADDYGLCESVSIGIVKAMKEGIVTDTTAMANMPEFEKWMKYAMDQGITEMGIHLTLTCGEPLTPKSEIKSILTEENKFYRKPYLIPKTFKLEEIEKELRAKIEKFKSTGMKLNHIDSHHHAYAYDENVFRLVVNIANELNIPIRNPFEQVKHVVKEEGGISPDHIIMDFYEENASVDFLLERLEFLKDKYEVVELMCHPSLLGADLTAISTYDKERKEELETLTSEKVKKFIKDNNIELIKYSEF